MDNRQIFSAVTSQFSLACSLTTLTYLATLKNGDGDLYYPLVLLLYAPLLFIVNHLFLRRERTMRGVFILNMLLWAGIFASVCWQEGGSDFASLGFAAAFCLWVTVRGAQMALNAPSLRTLILNVDCSAILLVLFTGYLAISENHTVWGVPIALGFAASILGMMANRMDHGLGGREWCLVAGTFMAISLVVLLLINVVAEPAGQGVVALWMTLVAAGKFILGLVWKFLLWFSSLFSVPESGTFEMEQTVQLPGMEEEAAAENPFLLVVMVVIGIMVGVALLIFLLYRLGKLHIGGRKGKTNQPRGKRERLSLWLGFRRLFLFWINRIRMRNYLWKNRNRPVGLYFLLVHRCRIGPWRKKSGETPREFLMRLHVCAQGDLELEHALAELIPQVDRALYGPKSSRKKESTFDGASLIRRRVGSAVRRQFMRDCVSSIKRAFQQTKAGKNVLARS